MPLEKALIELLSHPSGALERHRMYMLKERMREEIINVIIAATRHFQSVQMQTDE